MEQLCHRRESGCSKERIHIKWWEDMPSNSIIGIMEAYQWEL